MSGRLAPYLSKTPLPYSVIYIVKGIVTVGKVIALTGAAGYVGGLLLHELRKQAWVERIIAFDVKPVAGDGHVISYCMDVRDGAALRSIFAEHAVTNLIHAAFVLNPPPHMTNTEMHTINVNGSQQVFRAAINHGVNQIVFISSTSVYGYVTNPNRKITEETVQQPTITYGQHNVEVERFLRGQGDHYFKSRVAIVRPTAIVGPHGKQASLLSPLINQPVFIVADGGHARTQALHEHDATSMITQVVERQATGVFNAAPDDSATWAEIGQVSGIPVVSFPREALTFATRFRKMVPGLTTLSRETVEMFSESLVVDNMAARQCLGWVPRYSTQQAFADFF
jgi:UDP-glucose 4-epimerase